MSFVPTISVGQIVSEWLHISGHTGRVDSTFVKATAHRAIGKMHIPSLKLHKIALVEVEGGGATLPDDFYKVIEMAYGPLVNEDGRPCSWHIRFKEAAWHCDTSVGFSDFDAKVNAEAARLELKVVCPKCGDRDSCRCNMAEWVVNYHQLTPADQYMLSTPNVNSGFLRQYYNSLTPIGVPKKPVHGHSKLMPEMRLMRPAMQTFALADTHVRGCLNLNKGVLASETVEYVIEAKTVRTNAPNGAIVVSYLAHAMDDEGYYMIPDEENMIAALVWDIEYHSLYRDIRSNVTGASSRAPLLQIAERNMREYKRQARIVATNPSYAEFNEIVLSELYRTNSNIGGRLDFDRRRSDYLEGILANVSNYRSSYG